MADDDETLSPALGGRLLGTQKVQQAIDSLTSQINDLRDSLKSVTQNISGKGVSGKGSLASDVWNGTSNWGGWSKAGGNGDAGNGGSPRFTGRDGYTAPANHPALNWPFLGMPPRSPYEATVLGGTNAVPAMPGPSGGNGPTPPPQSSGKSNGSAGRSFGLGTTIAAFSQWGSAQLGPQSQMDAYTTAVASTMGGSYYANRSMMNSAAFGGSGPGAGFALSGIGTSYSDVAQGASLRDYVSGAYGTSGARFSTVSTGQRQLGYLDPGLGASGSGMAMADIYSSQSLYGSMAMGYTSTIGQGGKMAPLASIMNNQMQRNFQGRSVVAPREMSAALGENGYLRASIEARARTEGWSGQTTNAYMHALQVRNQALNRPGANAQQFDSLLTQASGTGRSAQSAQDTLQSRYGVGRSIAQSLKNAQATQMGLDADKTDAYSKGIDLSTKYLSDIKGILQKIEKATGADNFLGMGGGVLGGLGNSASSALGTYGAMRGLGAVSRLGRAGRMGGSGGGTVASEGGAASGGLGSVAATGIGAAIAGAIYGAIHSPEEYRKGKAGEKSSGLWGFATDVGIPAYTLGGIMGAGSHSQSDGVSGGGSSSVAGGSSGSAGGNSGATGAQAVMAAEKYLGMPYHWGGNNPKSSFDCSGLMQYAYSQIGVKLPRTSAQQSHTGKPVDKNKLALGDLLFYHYGGNKVDHVAMYVGGGKQIAAPTTGEKVQIQGIDWKHFSWARRVLGSAGTLGSSAVPNQDGSGSNNAGSMGDGSSSWNMGGGGSGTYGSTEEIDAVMAGLSGAAGGVPSTSSTASSGASSAGSGSSSGSVGGDATTSSAPTSHSANQALGKKMAAAMGWTGQEWTALNKLVMQESGWNNTAQNPTSTAYGIFQFLNSTWGSHSKTSDPALQIQYGLQYIKSRYKDPLGAWAHETSHHWYDKGAWQVQADETARVHKDEMIIPANQAKTIRDALMTINTPSNRGGGTSGGVSITVPVTISPGMDLSSGSARSFGNQVAEAIASNDMIKSLQRGN